MLNFNTGKVVTVDVEGEMQRSYLDYAMSVIVERALPDVRDGLKPVQRRILYAMGELGLTPDRPHRKSAGIVGDVMGHYHPHGDAAIYDAMVRMAQDFSYRYLLVDGHGNFGSVDGDPPAAMRYTEARLSKLALEMLADIKKERSSRVPNYDETRMQPVVLPSRFPDLLVNGSSGIAVGMATNIPPHNLGEVIDGVVKLVEDPEITIQDLMKFIKGPDFPTGGLILGKEGIKDAYHTGRGQIRIRARAHFELMNNGKTRIVVNELPYMVNKANLIEKIAELVRERKIDGITDLRDESDRQGMHVVIELRRDANPNVVLNQLYKHTQMQDTFGVIMLALVDGRPRVLNLKEVLYYYLEHQKDVVTRRTRFELKKAEERAHILEGLKIALDHLDEVIKLIRGSKSYETAREGLMENFGLTEPQAAAILDMQLRRLTALEREKIEEEYRDLQKKIAYYKDLLSDVQKILGVIREELLIIREKFVDPRRSEITGPADQIEVEDLIADEDVVVLLTHQGYIKRLPVDTYRSQRRGGRGIAGMNTKEEDFVEHLFVTTTHTNILFFTNRGRAYRLKCHQIPEASRHARGTAIINLLSLNRGETINAVIPVKAFDTDQYLFMTTRAGTAKKTPLSEFDNVRAGGLIAINLEESDELVGVKLTDGKQEVVLVTERGLSIRFRDEEVRPMGRTAHGVKGIGLVEGDRVVGMDVVKPGTDILVVTKNGYGKRTPMDEYRVQSRGGKGIKTLKLTEKNGPIAGVKMVRPDFDVMVITAEGIIIRMPVETISIMGRDTQGVRLMRLDDQDYVVALAHLASKEDDDEVSKDDSASPSQGLFPE
ncbi:MAG: DNA gyrase subunit A [Firmicutes bacterium]|nr:DNA gyrase subunit A [Bacillota bacterium]